MTKCGYPKKFSMLRHSGEYWVMSDYTGEIAKPFELRKIMRMVYDMLVY